MATYFSRKPGLIGTAQFEDENKQLAPVLNLITSGQYRDIPPDIYQKVRSGQISIEEGVAAIQGTPIFNPSLGPLVDTGGGFKTASGQSAGYNPLTNRYELGATGKYAAPASIGSYQNNTAVKTYSVQPGDTLSAIAKKFGVGISDISGYRSGDINKIYPGENLSIGAGASPDVASGLQQRFTATSTNPESGVTTRGAETPYATSFGSFIDELKNKIFSSTAPNPTDSVTQAINQLSQLKSAAGIDTANTDLNNARQDLSNFEQTILSEQDRIKTQPVATTVIGKQLVKLDADTAAAYRSKQALVQSATERLQTATQQMSQLISLTQFNQQEARQAYEDNTNNAFKFIDLMQTQQNKEQSVAQAALTGFINSVKDNPDVLTKASAADKAQWQSWELSAGFPLGYTEGILGLTKQVPDFEFKGTVGSADTGYSAIMYNSKTGALKTVKVIGSAPTNVAPASVTPENQSLVDAFNFTSGRMSADERKANTSYFNGLLNAGRIQDAKDFVKSVVIANVPPVEQSKVIGRDQAIASLKDIKTNLDSYVTKGGDTGILTGTTESILEKVGKMKNKELATISNDIVLAIQAYRQAISGAAFTESESKQYEAVFPSVGKNPELNDAKITSLVNTFDRNNRVVVQSVIGASNYDKIFNSSFGTTPSGSKSSEGSTFISIMGNSYKLPF